MKILYIGDIMGPVGIDIVTTLVPKLRKEEHIDVVIAQAENVTDGKGITIEDFDGEVAYVTNRVEIP